jgi:hypothetical protein
MEFTKEELQALLGLLDLATKAGGLEVAQHAMPLALKVQTELNKEINNVSSNDPR